MSLQKRRMRRVYLRQRTASVRADKVQYEAAVEAAVSLQPLTGVMAAQMYGKELDEMRLLLTTPEVLIKEGMGVCVDVSAAEPPDYEVVYTADWLKHTAAHIRRIPEGKR